MNTFPKKTFAIVLVIAILIFGALFFFNRQASTAENTNAASSTKKSSFFPLGELRNISFDFLNPISDQNGSSGQNEQINLAPGTAGRMRRITEKSIAGFSFALINGTSSLIYLEKGSGQIWAIPTGAAAPVLIGNTNTESNELVYWGQIKNKISVISSSQSGNITKQNSAISFLLSSSTASSSINLAGPIKIDSLDHNIDSFAVSPKKDTVFSLNTANDQAVGSISDLSLSKLNKIFSSPHGEWLVSWPETNTIALITKPSELAYGFLYFLDTTKGTTKRILSDLPGLTAIVSPDARFVVYSTSPSLSMNVLDLKGGKYNGKISFHTIAEKCTWVEKKSFIYCAVPSSLPGGNYPDDWYTGEVSFNDDIWSYNIETGESKIIYDSKGVRNGNPVDVTNLTPSQDQKTLYFINKIDGKLWALDLGDIFPTSTN